MTINPFPLLYNDININPKIYTVNRATRNASFVAIPYPIKYSGDIVVVFM